jgi:hypothetical protein
MMNATLRRTNLSAHVISSVGWLGAVAAFLALSIAGLTSGVDTTVRGVYLAMNLIGFYVVVPLSIASSLTGLFQSLGTHWGLTKYYWVFTKFVLTIVATVLLLLHQFTAVAAAARAVAVPDVAPDLGKLGTQLVFDASLAITVLVVATLLSVFKPWGTMKPRRSAEAVTAGNAAFPGRIIMLAVGALLITVILLHLMGKGMASHGM